MNPIEFAIALFMALSLILFLFTMVLIALKEWRNNRYILINRHYFSDLDNQYIFTYKGKDICITSIHAGINCLLDDNEYKIFDTGRIVIGYNGIPVISLLYKGNKVIEISYNTDYNYKGIINIYKAGVKSYKKNHKNRIKYKSFID